MHHRLLMLESVFRRCPNVTHVPHRISCTVGTHASELPKTTFSGSARTHCTVSCGAVFYSISMLRCRMVRSVIDQAIRSGLAVASFHARNDALLKRCPACRSASAAPSAWMVTARASLPMLVLAIFQPADRGTKLIVLALLDHRPEPVLPGASVCSPDS